MAVYNQTTFGELKTILAGRLGDYNKVFWTDAELGRYIIEALRTWNAAAQYYRQRATFDTVTGQVFYDLGTVLSPALMARTLTDTSVIADICDCLMEPAPSGSTWNGTDKFKVSDLTDALQKARDSFLYETTSIETETSQLVVAAPPTGRITLTDQTIADIRRVDWLSLDDGKYHHLWREDEWGFNTTRRLWNTDSSMPESYSIVSVHPLQIQLSPISANGGTLRILTLKNGPVLTNSGTVLEIPNDFGWVVKWGALAILLNRDGQVKDPARTAYCLQRWKEGIALAKAAASVVQAEINGIPMEIDSLVTLDSTRPNWRNESELPTQLTLASWNLLGVAGSPDGSYSITCDVVGNANLPSANSDYIDIGWEYMDSIVGYAYHLAAFKMGGEEHQKTTVEMQDFYNDAMMHNAELRANAAFYDIIQGRARREIADRPPKVTNTPEVG